MVLIIPMLKSKNEYKGIIEQNNNNNITMGDDNNYSEIDFYKTTYEAEYKFICEQFPTITNDFILIDYVKDLIQYFSPNGGNKHRLYREQTQKSMKQALQKIHFNSDIYTFYVSREQEYDSFIENPFGNNIVDSVVACSKCKSKQTFNIEKQTRSLDEPTTIITICFICKHRQKYSG